MSVIDQSVLSLLQPQSAAINPFSSVATGGDPLTALRLAEKNQTRDVARTEQQADVKRDIAAFRTAVGKAKDVASLLKSPAVLKVLLTANGLGDELDATALARQALTSDPSDSKSLVNRLSDTRWKAVATTYQFATKGLAIISDPKAIATLTDGYAEVVWRKSLDATTPGLSDAMTFRERASNITSVDQILGDSLLRRVVTTTLNIPQQIAFQSIDAQERAITTRLDISKLKDPKFVDSFSKRYLLAAQTPTDGSTGVSLLGLAVQARGLVV
jgi:hypothetical protein